MLEVAVGLVVWNVAVVDGVEEGVQEDEVSETDFPCNRNDVHAFQNVICMRHPNGNLIRLSLSSDLVRWSVSRRRLGCFHLSYQKTMDVTGSIRS